MNRLDYMVQVEDLHASPELRGRITALAGEVKPPRRRLRPWMGVCAALAVVLLGVGVLNGTIPLLRIGGSSGSGGGGHDEASTFMSYAGPIFPLTLEEKNDGITAERNTTLDFAPWEPVWVESEYREEGGYWSRSTDILVTDSYTLANSTGEDQEVTVLYPFVAGLYEIEALRPVHTLDGGELQTQLHIGTYSGSFEGTWNGTIGGDPDGSVNLNYPESWADYKALLEDGSYLKNALGPGPDVTGVPVTVYKLTDPYSPPKDEEAGITNPSLRATFQLDYSKTKILTYGFHGASFDPEGGTMLQDFSIPQPGDRDYGTQTYYLIAVGEDIGDLTLQGFATGRLDEDAVPLDGCGATVERYETNLDAVLREILPQHLDLREMEGHTPTGLTFEQVYRAFLEQLLSYGVLADHTAERYDTGWLENIEEGLDRVCWLEAQVTIPAGESVTVEASFTKEASFDYACAHTKNRGVYGYDLVTQLGSNLTCTEQTATLEDRGLIEIVRQNFGFDLENGINTVTLDPAQEHYYLEVRRITE